MQTIPVFFHPSQLDFKPLYEWAFGKRIKHPETTRRAESILQRIKKEKLFEVSAPTKTPMNAIRETHNYQLVTLYNTAAGLPEGETVFPHTFPKKARLLRADPTNLYHAGFFCFDAGTPLSKQTLSAASWSAACAFDAAKAVGNEKVNLSYALSRPPGHHASKDCFGGYCYFNNAAIAAKQLRKKGSVVLLDIDFHHGNGTQEIFYRDNQVFTISAHGDPREFYPFVYGFSSETGIGDGEGHNLNYPLKKGTTFKSYKRLLNTQIIPNIKRYAPKYLIISAGFDTYKLDPVGGFDFSTEDYEELGSVLGKLGYPTVVVQEGGYYAKDLGANAVSFLKGVASALI